MDDTRIKWNERYGLVQVPNPVLDVLEQNLHLLPKSGKSLDLACGLGGNALRLAELGFESHAWDLSDSAIEKVQEFALERHLDIIAKQCDISLEEQQDAMCAEGFDVIVVGHFLLREVIPSLISALKPGGLIFYQTFVEADSHCQDSNEKIQDSGPRNSLFRLESNELLKLFSELTVRYYRDEGPLSTLDEGSPGEAYLVAQMV
ncbi:MAG: methyltransferase domain-containing protein [Gammaproteobacteria bacterium]|nr:methyltransferase domain-containing protein [Gammaproteobacteria bacterium]